jgi:hypothetical protein
MAETRVFVIQLNVIRETTDEQLIKSLNDKGIEVLEEIPADRYAEVWPLLEKALEKRSRERVGE